MEEQITLARGPFAGTMRGHSENTANSADNEPASVPALNTPPRFQSAAGDGCLRTRSGKFMDDSTFSRLSNVIRQRHDELIRDFQSDVLFWREEVEKRCKSEIEKLLLLAFLIDNPVRPRLAERADAFDISSWHPYERSGHSIVDVVVAQCPVGKYIADFAIRRFDFINTPDECETPILIVECGGHDFHERTKEQAAHDRSRDREMSLAGYHVMRFTGSEIWKDPGKCAEQIEQWLRRHGDAALELASERDNAKQLQKRE